MPALELKLKDEQDTQGFGEALAAALPDGAVVALIGTLGAGKTRLVQAVANASGIDPRDVTSPTFVLINEYAGRRPIYHFDAYRVRDDDEFLQLGPDEYFDGGGITFVEWADRVAACLPEAWLEIQIEITGETSRRLRIHPHGAGYDDVIERLRQLHVSQRPE